MFALRARTSVLLIYLPNEYYNYKRWYTIHPHQAYLCSLNELYFLIFAISILNFLKPEQIHSEETTMRRSIFPNVCHHKTAIFWASCTRNQMSVLDCRQNAYARTNARKDGTFPKYNCFFTVDFFLVWGNCEWNWRIIRNIAHLMNRGMLGADELCITFHNYNTHWQDKLETH